MDEYEKQVQQIKKLQQDQLVNQLKATQQSALSELSAEEQAAKKTYDLQREQSNINSQVNKLNFAEFLANRGQTSSGLAIAGELSRQNVIARDISGINTTENTTLADINRRRTQAGIDYNTNLSSGLNTIEQNIADKLLAHTEQLRQKALSRASSKTSSNSILNFSDDTTDNNTASTINSSNNTKSNSISTDIPLHNQLLLGLANKSITTHDITNLIKASGTIKKQSIWK